ncbi:helix-turn-helix domain-containing protein [Paenibacillus sp. MBLB4367]|uniref:helix-turn-helix domain-containing protein n=1 Tax=Paenibacillus sp. MBLB4367 TaxID=3384767 RepID=UPI003907E779
MHPISKDSRKKLYELDLSFQSGNAHIKVHWFRIKEKKGRFIVKRHSHAAVEIHFIAKGSCRFLFDHAEHLLYEGDAIVIAPHVSHAQRHVDGQELLTFILCFDIELGGEDDEFSFLSSQFADALPVPFAVDEKTQRLYFDSLEEATQRKDGFMTAIKSFFLTILVALSRQMADASKAPKAPYQLKIRKNMNDKRMDVIHEHLSKKRFDKITVADISKLMGLSEKQLNRIVKECHDMTPNKLIAKSKLQAAKALLEDTEMTIQEISEKLGFSNEYYFNRFFKREEGMPPGLYRSSVKDTRK